jgi:hypothetical protein
MRRANGAGETWPTWSNDMGVTPDAAAMFAADRTRRTLESHRWSRLAPRLIVAAAGAFVIAMVVLYWREQPASFGYDFSFYVAVARRWLETGVYYVPYQIEGPYPFHDMVDNLYPPSALFLFVPAALAPAIAWWLIPGAVIVFALWTWRPSPWGWALIALLMCWPKSYIAWIFGNTEIWVVAAVAGGLLWSWPAAIIPLLKPVFAPLGLIGVRRRSWWIASATTAAISLPLLSLWLDYPAVVTNVEMESDLVKFQGVPMLLVPIIAWLKRRRPVLTESDLAARRAPLTVPAR